MSRYSEVRNMTHPSGVGEFLTAEEIPPTPSSNISLLSEIDNDNFISTDDIPESQIVGETGSQDRTSKRVISDSDSDDMFQDHITKKRNIVRQETEKLKPVIQTGKIQQNMKMQMRANSDLNNLTNCSTGENRIVIIQPEVNLRNMMSSPGKFSKAFEKSDFGKAKIKDIRTNFKRGLVIVELEAASNVQDFKLLDIKEIGEWTVRCYVPRSDKFTVGIISGIDVHETIEINDFRADSSDLKIIKIDRLSRTSPTGEKSPSPTLKITFESGTLPEYVKFHHFRYKVRPYIPNPTQCYRCQRLGHVALGCKAPDPRCLFCAGKHDKDKCGDKTKLKCANCNLAHRANSRDCKYLQQGHLLEKTRAMERYTSNVGRMSQDLTGNSREGNVTEMEHPVNEQPNQLEDGMNQSYSQVVSSQTSQETAAILQTIRKFPAARSIRTCLKCLTCKKDQSTQTEESIPTKTENDLPTMKLLCCMVEIFTSDFTNTSIENRKRIVHEAFENYFGIRKKTSEEIMNSSIEEGVLSDNTEVSSIQSRPTTRSIWVRDNPGTANRSTKGKKKEKKKKK